MTTSETPNSEPTERQSFFSLVRSDWRVMTTVGLCFCSLIVNAAMFSSAFHHSNPDAQQVSTEAEQAEAAQVSAEAAETETAASAPARTSEEVTLTITLTGNYDQFAQYSANGGSDGIQELLTALANVCGTTHEPKVNTQDGDHVVFILQRSEKPAQSIRSLSVAGSTVTVGFEAEPTEPQLQGVFDALAAEKDAIGVDVSNASWSGKGTIRTLTVTANK